MNTAKIQDEFIKQHRAFENKALRILLTEYKKIIKSIKFDRFTFNTTVAEVFLNIEPESLKKAMYKIHYTTGKQYGLSVARQLRKDNPIQEKRWNPLPFFSESFQEFLINYYKVKGGDLIVTLNKTLAERVVGDILSGTYKNETIHQMTERMYKTVNDPKYYKWMCMRIARTETTYAMNAAKVIAGDTSGVLMEKVWIAILDGRERASHVAVNGMKVGQNEKFTVGADKMFYPGDRDNGSKKECINCRCTFGYVAKRDERGRLIFTD